MVSDPEQDATRVLCVSFTSHTVAKDPTCIVQPSEFPLLDHASSIAYFDVKVASVAALEAGIQSSLIQKRTPVSDALLRRIRDGFNATRDTKFEHIQVLIDQGLIEVTLVGSASMAKFVVGTDEVGFEAIDQPAAIKQA